MRSLVLLVLLGACSSEPFVATPHAPLPQIAKHAGIVIDAPQIVTVTFPGYEFTSQAQALGDFIGGSSWLTTVGAEYGVGAGTSKAKVVWPQAAPAMTDDQGLRALITQGLMDGTLPAPSGEPDELVYLFYWPPTSILNATSTGLGALCMRGSFHSAGDPFLIGYHDSLLAPDGTRVPYAIIGDCGDGVDEVTSTASRELIGSLTNPFEVDGTGWLLDVAPPDPWYTDINNGEVGYMCERELRVQEGGFALHRSWSNAAAAQSSQPCLPSPEGDAYDNVTTTPSTIVTAAAGQTLTFQITGWSNRRVSSWKLLVAQSEGSAFTLADMNPTLDDYTIQNGETRTLTIHVPAKAQSGDTGAVNVMSGPQQHAWPVAFTLP